MSVCSVGQDATGRTGSLDHAPVRGLLASMLGASVLLGSAPGLAGQDVSDAHVRSRLAESAERAEALAVALEAGLSPIGEGRLTEGLFLLDTLRTVTHEADRGELLQWLAERIGAELGNVEEHCVRIQDRVRSPGQELGIPQSAVRPASLIVAAEIVEWSEGEAGVRVTHWQGQGLHTGFSVELRVERSGTRWEVAEPLTASTGGCIRGSPEPLEVSLTGLALDVLRATEVGDRIFVSFLDSIRVWVEGGVLGVVPEDLKDLVWEHGAVVGEVIEVSEDPPSVRVVLR